MIPNTGLEILTRLYRQELVGRTFESIHVRNAKIDLLNYLTQFDESTTAPNVIDQITAKLAVLDRISVGRTNSPNLSDDLTQLKTDIKFRVQFKQSSFVKHFLDGLLQFFGLHPYQHFDDVITNVAAALKKEKQKLLVQNLALTETVPPPYPEDMEKEELFQAQKKQEQIRIQKKPLIYTADQIAEFPELSPSSLHGDPRTATPEQALRDFAGRTTIDEVRFEADEDFMEASYRRVVAAAIDNLTAKLDGRSEQVIPSTTVSPPEDGFDMKPFAENSFAYEVWHTSPQGLVGCVQQAMMKEIPSFGPLQTPGFGNLKLNWGVDAKGLYCDYHVDVISVTKQCSDGEVADTLIATTDGELRPAEEGELSKRKLSGEPAPAIVELRGQVRYTRNEESLIKPHMASYEVVNHHPEEFPYSNQAYRFAVANDAAELKDIAVSFTHPGWIQEAGVAGVPDPDEKASLADLNLTRKRSISTTDEGEDEDEDGSSSMSRP